MLSRNLLFAALIGSSALLACKDKPAENAADAAPATPPATASVTPKAAESAAADGTPDKGDKGDKGDRGDRHRGRFGGGPGAILFRAVKGAELKDEQKAKVEAAEKTAKDGADAASKEAAKEAVKALHTDLVAAIKAGKIEPAKLEPRYAALEKSAKAEMDKDADALNALHAALEPAQRKAAVASIRAKQAARDARVGERKGKEGDEKDGKRRGGKSHLDRLTRDLDLDAEQQKKVDALQPKGDVGADRRAEMKKRNEALLAAFEKDTFDAKKLELFDGKKARVPMEEQTKLLAALIPILKPEQREKLAAKMDKGPSPHGRRGGGFDHRVEDDDDDDDDKADGKPEAKPTAPPATAAPPAKP